MKVVRASKKDRRGIEEGSKKGGGWELKIENWELKIGVDGFFLHTPRRVADPSKDTMLKNILFIPRC